MIRTIATILAAVAFALGTAGAASASTGGTTVYVYTDDPSQAAALCAEARAEWGPADHCRVLPARYADVSVGEAADLTRDGW